MSARTIELSKKLDAPADAVFRALTDADELRRWFPSHAESDARSGGSFEYRFAFDDASRDHTYSGEYIEVAPNERVRYPWRGRLGETTVDFTLQPRDGSTEVRLVHAGWGDGPEWTEALEMHRGGWSFFLENLKSYLERGVDARAAQLGMETAATV